MTNIDIDRLLISFFGEDYHDKVDAKNIARLKTHVMPLSIEDKHDSQASMGVILIPDYPSPYADDSIFISQISREIHAHNVHAGWWSDIHTGEKIKRNKHELLGLVASEIFEAFDGARKDLNDSHLPHYKAVCVEMADAIIRIFDYAGKYNINPFYIMEGRLLEECRVVLSDYPDSYKQKATLLQDNGYNISVQAIYQIDLMKNFVSKKMLLNTDDSDGNIFSKMFRISSLLGVLSFIELNNGENKIAENIIISSVFLMILDFCDREGHDLLGAIVDKIIYNKNRADHKKENRLKNGGKLI